MFLCKDHAQRSHHYRLVFAKVMAIPWDMTAMNKGTNLFTSMNVRVFYFLVITLCGVDGRLQLREQL